MFIPAIPKMMTKAINDIACGIQSKFHAINMKREMEYLP